MFSGIFKAMERLGVVPVNLVMLMMLSKPEGGHRLIGLLTGQVRLWGRARRSFARKWEQEHDRDYFWAKGLQVGSSLLDLVKCYEQIQHWVLTRGAKEQQF
eukprot:7144993-Heterocapsa_arctica.AAC.1